MDEDRIKDRLLKQLDTAWTALQESYAGLSEEQLVEPGVVENWSVKDILAHVTTWEEEALKHLPVIIKGGRPPRYATVGGIDAFNAQMTERKRDLPLAGVLQHLQQTHRRLVSLIESTPAAQLSGESRARRRLRLDTYSHYPLHTAAIRQWREQQPGG